MKYVCAHCNTEYHIDHVKAWGTTAESSGYGPQAVCTALVPDRAKAGSNAVCRGPLVAVPSKDAAEVAALAKKLTPITSNV